jgi:hypothetical protein
VISVRLPLTGKAYDQWYNSLMVRTNYSARSPAFDRVFEPVNDSVYFTVRSPVFDVVEGRL